MNSKLTLKLDSQVIARVKTCARKRKTSLSKLIETYLQPLTSPSEPEPDEITPLVKSLSIIARNNRTADYKKVYGKRLDTK
ncbi:MAG: DUF6364 family protein [Bacteroidota bacterium]